MIEFLEAFKSTHIDLQPEIVAKDGAAVKVLTHRLIGLCPTFDAHELADLARGIEECVTVDDWQTATKYFQELDSKFKQFSNRLIKN